MKKKDKHSFIHSFDLILQKISIDEIERIGRKYLTSELTKGETFIGEMPEEAKRIYALKIKQILLREKLIKDLGEIHSKSEISEEDEKKLISLNSKSHDKEETYKLCESLMRASIRTYIKDCPRIFDIRKGWKVVSLPLEFEDVNIDIVVISTSDKRNSDFKNFFEFLEQNSK